MREITRGTGRSSRSPVEGLTAEMFNAHFASISTDCDYRAPLPKHTAQLQNQYITENVDVFLHMNTGWRAQNMYVCMYVCI